MMESGSAPSVDCPGGDRRFATAVHLNLRADDLGSTNCRELAKARRVLHSAIDAAASRTVQINLCARRVGAAIVGILAEADAAARKQGGRVRLSGTAPQVREVLVVCGQSRLLD